MRSRSLTLQKGVDAAFYMPFVSLHALRTGCRPCRRQALPSEQPKLRLITTAISNGRPSQTAPNKVSTQRTQASPAPERVLAAISTEPQDAPRGVSSGEGRRTEQSEEGIVCLANR